MSDLVRIVPPEHVAARRAIARGEWLCTVGNSRMDGIARAVLTDPRTLAAWWPNPHTQKTEAA